MARQCEVCGKRAAFGNKVTTRGKAKYLGGVGTKITGVTRRLFQPNLQRVRITEANGTVRTIRVCARCIRSGRINKRVYSRPFRLPPAEAAKVAAGGAVAKSGKKGKRKEQG